MPLGPTFDFTAAFPFLKAILPLAAALFLALLAWKVWIQFINRAFINSLKWVLLEVRIPKEVFKSPLAMELVLINAFHQSGGTGTWYNRWWEGKVRQWFSLEIVSLEGNIFFLIRIPQNYRNLVESQIYSQYPQAEIKEAPDYTEQFPVYVKDGGFEMWGCEFKLTKPDPYPIKTYIDYGLDRATGSLEEQQKIDPITPTVEFFGSLKQGNYVWMQILIRAATERFHKKGSLFGKQSFMDAGKDLIKELKAKYGGEGSKMTMSEQKAITSIDLALGKLAFDVGIRAIYLAKKEAFDPINITGMTGTFRQYSAPNSNGFGIGLKTGYDFPWQDIGKMRSTRLKKKLLRAYRQRSYFYTPQNRTPFVLNSEELATIFHFPGRVLETPTFERILSKKAEPPTNLPI
ncbi:MAG TPA: hypothetical protein VJ103_02080 [Candidatus Paceibacterota bacterium]|nr:hypothetical protein [Candidatus Paceibacterota bacterium]